MKGVRKASRRGFSLVELLAVVLILAVLAAVAVPLYINTRKTSAARACKANINAIASAEAAHVLRNGTYADMATLTASGPEGLAGAVTCPLDRAAYTGPANVATAITIACPNQAAHQTALGVAVTVTEWSRTMPAVASEAAVP